MFVRLVARLSCGVENGNENVQSIRFPTYLCYRLFSFLSTSFSMIINLFSNCNCMRANASISRFDWLRLEFQRHAHANPSSQ